MSNPGALPLDALDLGVASALVLVAGVISVMLRLGLERRLFIASVRTVVQLLLIGYLLRWIFAISHFFVIAGVLLGMIFVASRAAVARSSRTFVGARRRAFLTLVLVAFTTTFAVTRLIIGVDPWYTPQYAIPLCGMILGNSLTGISLCLDSLLERFDERRAEIELELCLGATAWEAAEGPLAAAVKRGMIPIINSMMVVGLVSLPGMMTGQILAGASPLGAVKYQIMVMFMLAASTALGCILVATLAYRKFFNDRSQLCADLIKKKNER